jgi:hypothetical protein
MKYNLVVACILPLVLIMTACTSSEPAAVEPIQSPVSEPAESFENPYSMMGEKHNRALNAALQALKDSEGGLSIEETEDLVVRAIQRHASEQGIAVDLVNAPDYQPPSTFPDPYLSIRDVVDDSTLMRLTDRQEFYLDAIVFTMNRGYTPDEFSEELRVIEVAASDELGTRDAAWVLQGAAIARSSTYYWSENKPRWVRAISEATLTELQPSTGADAPLKEIPIGIRDVGGKITYIWRDGTRITVIKSASASAREVLEHSKFFAR